MSKDKVAIIGSGIAGGILSWELIKRGQEIIVFNKPNPNSSSRVAAGLVNAIIPRRVTKTWLADEIFPNLHSFYQTIEKKLESEFFHPNNVIHIFEYSKEQNDWLSKVSNSKFDPYFSDKTIFFPSNKNLKSPLGAIRIDLAGHCDTEKFLNALENHFNSLNVLRSEEFQYDLLEPLEDGKYLYKEEVFDKVIFAEGIDAQEHYFFKNIPFVPVKGELLKIKVPQLKLEQILLGGVFVIPLGNDEYYLGSTYEWDYNDVLPTEKGKNKLLKRFSDYSDLEVEVLEQRAGVRPAIKDRRPVLGEHKEHKNLYLFNGFGSKAVSLVPYFANHFCEFILENKSLMDEVNFNRFNK